MTFDLEILTLTTTLYVNGGNGELVKCEFCCLELMPARAAILLAWHNCVTVTDINV